jgi:hypothetical protein
MILSDGETLPMVDSNTFSAAAAASFRQCSREIEPSVPWYSEFRCFQTVMEKIQSSEITVRIHWSGVKEDPGWRSL